MMGNHFNIFQTTISDGRAEQREGQMTINCKGRFLSTELRSYEDKKTHEKKSFNISKVFLEGSDEVAEVFSQTEVGYKRNDVVDIRINADLSTKKVSCNFVN